MAASLFLFQFGIFLRQVVCLVSVLLVAAVRSVEADESPSPDAMQVLETHCVRCHDGDNAKGGLDLTTRTGLVRGGESGEPLLSDDPDASLLLKTIRHEHEPFMPFKQPKLSDAAIATLSAWIKTGADYSRTLKAAPLTRNADGFEITDADRRHWAFQPVKHQLPPIVSGSESNSLGPVDEFIRLTLNANGLSLSPVANREILIRRVTFDLIGLPPSPEEIDEFVADPSPCAYERFIDRLLASPHYGERWGRHWLDLARYAETDGFEHDAVRPHTWRYRDYVIQSFNADIPYDRFVREQIAGDELAPGDPLAMTATGFNLLGPDMVDSSDQVQRRHNTLNDMTDTMALAFLGLTIGCARCHDHKFEPLSQCDYYSLQAFFSPTRFEREKPIPTPEEQSAFQAGMRAFNEHPKLREMAELEAPVRERLYERKLSELSVEAQSAHRTTADQRTSEQANLVLETADKVKVSDKELVAALTDDQKRQHVRLQDEIKQLPRPVPLPKAMVLQKSGQSAKTFILNRGEYSQPCESVTPQFPEVLQPAIATSQANSTADPKTALTSSSEVKNSAVAAASRRHLADWLASDQNPLTARVFVNRIWQHHFGRGLVATPSDFGTHGQVPTHPELLDWLAFDFRSRDFRIKRMHRLLLASATYRQISSVGSLIDASDGDDSSDLAATWKLTAKKDPENRLYWRMNRLRLEGEVIRDSLLAVSGQLNRDMGGPGVFPPIPKELFAGSKGWSTSESPAEEFRRSTYIFARRNLRFPFLEVFDAPDSNLSCPVREGSTTAPQSLTMLNADEVTVGASNMAAAEQARGRPVEEQIESTFRLIVGRRPKPDEVLMVRQFLTESPYSELCRALFNLNEFVYVK